jgi:hypothetical protein
MKKGIEVPVDRGDLGPATPLGFSIKASSRFLIRSPSTAALPSSINVPFTPANAVSGSETISLNSFVVNATCPGPLLPTERTLRTADLLRTSSTLSGISVPSRPFAPLRSIRATSSATLPCPTTLTSSIPRRSTGRSANAGWPLYQLTKANAGNTLTRGLEEDDEPETEESGFDRDAP